MKVGNPLEQGRVEESTKEKIGGYFEVIGKVIKDKGIKTGNIVNIDENRVAVGEIRRYKVLGSSESKKADLVAGESDSWTSIIEAITGDGRRLTPILVFEGGSL
ncbi:hypothetical protein VMCG_03957 [Cytospora schulzeri]|uniref:Uncharacterized protein n=1 Tax=Cytospora schulzeri TaxID=448051 RepID=A0A423WUP9_9PEZI|nr:hypothetical protein VMCG_03957 [Valsa malicola]